MTPMRELRRSSGKTLETCAQEAGVSIQRWCCWERKGWINDREMTLAVVRILGGTLNQFAGLEPIQKANTKQPIAS